jgi:hypothetical protein
MLFDRFILGPEDDAGGVLTGFRFESMGLF